MIVQSHIEDEKTCLSFTIPSEEYDDAWNVAKKLVDKKLCRDVDGARQVAKLSVSGIGVHSHTEVAERMFRALGEAGINIQMVSTSEVRVNVIVDGSQGEAALALLKEAFADVMPK
jgi:aspartate kinase